MSDKHKSINKLGELQRVVMEILWDQDEASVAKVLALVNKGRSKELAYTTILTVMQKLEAAGWLTHRSEGRTYVYRAKRSRERAGGESLRMFVNQVFAGDPLVLFQHLLKHQEMSDEELRELRRMIDRHRSEQRDAPEK